MPEQADLRTIRYYLENARVQLRDIYSRHGTNAKDSLQQSLEEALKEIRKAEPARSTLESAAPAL